jgi:hypothetical protein
MTPQQALDLLISMVAQGKYNLSAPEMAQFLQQLDFAKAVLSEAIKPKTENKEGAI